MAPGFSSKPKEVFDYNIINILVPPCEIIALSLFDITEDDWKKDALDKAWRKEDIKDDRQLAITVSAWYVILS